MGDSRPQAAIAGAGVAGIAAALALDGLGYRVTLLEKKPVCGGRTFSFKDRKTGAAIDNGQHLLIGAYHETLKLLESVGAKHKVAVMRPTVVPLFDAAGRKGLFRLGLLPPPLGLLAAAWRYPHFSLGDKLSLFRLGAELRRIRAGKVPAPESVTVAAWLESLGQTGKAARDFWEILTLATLNDAPQTASADALAAVLIKSFFSGRGDGLLIFPKAGLSEVLVNPALAYLKMRGHEIRSGTGLDKISVLNGTVRNFTLDGGEILKADLYVSAVPPQRLLNSLPKPFVATRADLAVLETFRHSPIVSVNLFYDRPVMDDAFAGSAATRVHWFFNRNRLHAAEKAPYHHVVGVASGAYELASLDKRELTRVAHEDLCRLYPKAARAALTHALVNVERRATLSCPPGVNARRPCQKILDNFYTIGDWTRTGLPPTVESAAVSARLMAEDVAHAGKQPASQEKLPRIKPSVF